MKEIKNNKDEEDINTFLTFIVLGFGLPAFFVLVSFIIFAVKMCN